MPSFTCRSLILAFSLVSACGNPGEEDKEPPTESSGNDTSSTGASTSSTGASSGPTISYAKDIEPIFLTSCAICHLPGGTGVGQPDTDLDLSEGVGYAALTSQASVATGTKFIGPTLEQSYLWAKLEGTQPPAGSTMPQGTVLFGDQLTLITQWIEGGALP